MKLRWFIGMIVLIGCQISSWAQPKVEIHMICNQLDFTNLTIEKLIQHYRSYRITVTQVISCYLKNIKKLNPSLNAIIQVNPKALEQADRLDLWRNGFNPHDRPLFGVPILIPDNFATFDEMETTAGSNALLGIKPKRDAHIVTLLREAGAIILGKTNPSEFSGFRFSKNCPGLSERGNQTIHPFDRTREVYGDNPGGAIAVVSKLTLVALGTSLDGSISSPASELGIVGISPSYDMISNDGIIFCKSLDKVGIFANSLEDAISILNVIVNNNENVSFENEDTDEFDNLTLNGSNIGKIDHYFRHASVKSQFNQFDKVFDIFKRLGAFTTKLEFQVGDYVFTAFVRQLIELDTVIYHYLHNNVTHTDTASDIFSLDDIVRLNYYSDINNNDNILYLASSFRLESGASYASYTKLIHRLTTNFMTLMMDNNLTVIAVPGHHSTLAYSLPSLLKLPTITLPIISSPSLSSSTSAPPLGLTLFGLPGTDSLLLKIASIYQSYQSTKKNLKNQVNQLERDSEKLTNLTKSINELIENLGW